MSFLLNAKRPLNNIISDKCTAITEFPENSHCQLGFFLSEMNGFTCFTFLFVFLLFDMGKNRL